jgi:ceramide glucosyltransferase
MIVIYALATVLTLFAAVLTSVQTALTLLFRRRGRFFAYGPHQAGPFRPDVFSRPRRVSVLKPVCGVDDELEANLESFAAIRGVSYEVIVSIADPRDPALPIVEGVMARNRHVRWKLVIGGDAALEHGNRKIARLIAAMPHATGDVILISDSNVRVQPDDLLRTIAAFDDPRTGCVSNLFTGSGAQSFGASIESLHLLSFVVTGAVIAAAAKVPCVVGKSMAIRRDVLRSIGGFEAFANVLAEDQAIGLAVRNAGFDVVLSPVVVRNVVVNRTIKRALDRQIRWNKIRYSFSSALYSTELLVNPLPFAIFSGHLDLMLAVALLRMLQIAVLSWSTDARLTPRDVALTPILDLLQFAAQFVPYYDDTVTWRGYRVRLGPNTQMLADSAAA